MKNFMLAVCALVTLGACAEEPPGDPGVAELQLAAPDDPPVGDDLLDRLHAIPGLTVVEELPVPNLPDARFFSMTYTQPIDHLRPWAGTFEQRVTLLHRDTSKPVVLFTTGYDLPILPFLAEPTRIVEGNQIAVEERFFVPSRPVPTDWSKLNIFQAASDHHRVVKAFRRLYGAPWVSTGHSKGGMTSIYHRRFFPADVVATVAYVAPQDTFDDEDSRYQTFLDHVGNDPACRAALLAVQRQALLRRDEMLAMLSAYAAENGFTFTHLDLEQSLESAVLDLYWTFWQYGKQADCPNVPPADAPTADIFKFMDDTVYFGFYTDQGLEPYIPYYYQAATELGSPAAPERDLLDLLHYPGFFGARAFVPAEIPVRFHPLAMLDIDLWVRLFGRRLLFVYGSNDPWSAEPFELGPGTRDSYVYTVAGGNHGSVIGRLPLSERYEAANRLRAWVNLPPLTPPPPPPQGASSKAAAAPAPEAFAPVSEDLDPSLWRRPRL